MKVRTVELAGGKKMGVVWCMGCGAFHGFPADKWNGDEKNPSTTEALTFTRGDATCTFTIKDSTIVWDVTSSHRLAATARQLPHEETWNVHGPDQPKQPKAPDTQKAAPSA